MTDTTSKGRHAGSFGDVAALYERSRPTYPSEAIDWLLPKKARLVVDLGAGTGKLARDLVSRGLEVLAVEPSDGMRAELTRVLPGVRTMSGRGESIPLAPSSVDAVLVAQAWHWVDPIVALPEVGRVLKPGGRLGLIWNSRDESIGWIAALGRIIHRHGFAEEGSKDVDIGAPFGAAERHESRWSHHITVEELLELVASRSYFILLTAKEQDAVLRAVRSLIAMHPGTVGAHRLIMTYVTRCIRADLPA